MMNEEARDGSLLTVTSETTNSEGNVRWNPVGKVSMGFSVALSNNKRKILPRYLGTSVGSCHDFCKYGRNRTFESKGKRLMFPRYSGSSETQEKEQNRLKSLNLAERQKQRSIKQKDAPHVKIEPYDRPKICEEETLSPVEKVIKCTKVEIVNRTSLILEKPGLSKSSENLEFNFPSPTDKFESSEEFETIKLDTPVNRIALCDDSASPSDKFESSEEFEAIKQDTPVNRIALCDDSEAAIQKTAPLPEKIEVSEQFEAVKIAISPEKPRVRKKEAAPCQRLDATVRAALSGKSKMTTLKPISQENPTIGTASRKNEKKGAKNMEPLKLREKRTSKQPSGSLSPQPPLNHVPNSMKSTTVMHPRKVGKTQVDYAKIEEKTLYVIEPRAAENINSESAGLKASNYQSSFSSSSSPSLLSSSPSVSDYKGDGNRDAGSAFMKTNKAGQNSRRGVATVHPEEKDPTPHKLKFRRGKVINPQSDNNGPRRLRFRQGRRVNDNQSCNIEGEKRRIRVQELACGDLSHPEPEAQTVVLRHQDVQDKETMDLFNQIIEETASKLVETRKSKVKALVGAFETVISLQESKPAASV